MTRENPVDLLPELFVLGAAVTGLLAGSFLPRTRQWIVAALCAACLAGSGVPSRR